MPSVGALWPPKPPWPGPVAAVAVVFMASASTWSIVIAPRVRSGPLVPLAGRGIAGYRGRCSCSSPPRARPGGQPQLGAAPTGATPAPRPPAIGVVHHVDHVDPGPAGQPVGLREGGQGGTVP